MLRSGWLLHRICDQAWSALTAMPGPGPKDTGSQTLAETAQQPSAAWQDAAGHARPDCVAAAARRHFKQLTLDDHALAEAEGERLAAVIGGVKLLAVGEGALRKELGAARVTED